MMETFIKENVLKNVEHSAIEELVKSANLVSLDRGQLLTRPNIIESHAFIVIEGQLRYLATEPVTGELFTVGTSTRGDFVGIVDLLTGEPCEAAIAKTECRLISISIIEIKKIMNKYPEFEKEIHRVDSVCEKAKALISYSKTLNPSPLNVKEWLAGMLSNAVGKTVYILSKGYEERNWNAGQIIEEEQLNKLSEKETSHLRPIKVVIKEDVREQEGSSLQINQTIKKWSNYEGVDMQAVGLRDPRRGEDMSDFRLIRSKDSVGKNLATLKMLARAYDTPCPIDVIQRVLEGADERSVSIPIHTIGQLVESMGLETQVGTIKFKNLSNVELPVVTKLKESYVLITKANKNSITVADPASGYINMSEDTCSKELGTEIKILLVKRLQDTPRQIFGWSWFSPVVKKFKWPLLQVLLASLFIQLFQLANPLLLQQIIDKVISQSNLSALQVLGAALVAAALFQGLLTALRTWLLVDTTDRMDLLLGSQVIDKLLRLPLAFFEKRPVGELSQRLGELGNLRSFLTGTAITSSLDIVFATVYIFIMITYSGILTAVALSTIPLYVIMILVISPVYRKLLRRQAQHMAKTQSHLIETLSGIQTVKAQHFELNSRWRWQERYSSQIAEAFKKVVLGSSASEIGKFLNQLSSLLIIWVGVYQVVGGNLSLGQLIAFRIIAGYVTGPILRLSSLYQGYQQVEISMERLADIIDQTPEAGDKDGEQISLPPIKGKVAFQDVKYKFNNSKTYQVDNVSLEIPAGSFVGIVGQSGSGKSTLMKLVPRLYIPEEGRILIDDYDVNKVSLSSVRQQIGIVPQDCLLFEGTIKDNITMNQPEAETEAIVQVAKAAEAHDFIMDLPAGYNTELGERGAGLSGGQRQRIAIARTLLQNPNLLILDEATSALDYDTEANVSQNLQQALKGKTVFYITHRLSTVRKADIILMMHNGRIAEMGTHNELMRDGGRYAALYSHQDA